MARFQHVKDVDFLQRVITLYEREIARLRKANSDLRLENARLADNYSEAEQQELGNLKKELERLHKALLKARNQAQDGQGTEATPESDPQSPEQTGPAPETGDTMGPGTGSDGAASPQEGDGGPPKRTRKPRTRFGYRPQPFLPTEDELYELNKNELECPLCELELHPLKDMYEISIEIDIIEPKVVLRRLLQQKYGCKNRCTIITAPGPAKLGHGSLYSPDFGLEIAAAKYLDNTPLERQVRRFERLGLMIDSQTLFDQLYLVFEYVSPTVEAIYNNLMCQDLLHADETPWPMLEGPMEGRWTLWTLVCDHGAFFSGSSTRSAVVADVLLGGYEGTVVCDAASMYPALAEHGGKTAKVDMFEMFMPSGEMTTHFVREFKWVIPHIVLAYCWAHVLRRFRDCAKDFPRLTKEPLTLIRKLYAAEEEAERLARARAGPNPDDVEFETHLLSARRELREAVSRPVLEQLRGWLETPRVLPSTRLGEAIDYTLHNWKGLTVFLDDPAVVLDNNIAERTLRQAVVGRKVYYGSHSSRGIQVACAFYTLFESARLNGLEPVEYLRRVLYAALAKPGTVTLPWDVARLKKEGAPALTPADRPRAPVRESVPLKKTA